MYQMKRFIIDMKQSPLSICFCFYQLGLCSVTYTVNEYSIYHFYVMIKAFSISFSRVIIVQDFETVIFMYHLDNNRALLFSVESNGCTFQVSSIGFSFYTFPHTNLLVL